MLFAYSFLQQDFKVKSAIFVVIRFAEFSVLLYTSIFVHLKR